MSKNIIPQLTPQRFGKLHLGQWFKLTPKAITTLEKRKPFKISGSSHNHNAVDVITGNAYYILKNKKVYPVIGAQLNMFQVIE